MRNRGCRVRKEGLRCRIFRIILVDVSDGHRVAAEERHAGQARIGAVHRREKFAFEVAERRVRALELQFGSFPGAGILQRHADGFAACIVLVTDEDLELHRVFGDGARNGIAVFADELEPSRCAVALAELDIVGSVDKGAAAVFEAFGAFRIRACEDGHIDLVRSDGHLGRNIQVELSGKRIVNRRGLQRFLGQGNAVHPDTRHVAGLGNQGRSLEMHRADGGIELDVGTVRNVERRVEGNRHLVVRLLVDHLRIGRAESDDKFVLAIDDDIRVNRSFVLVAFVLAPDGHPRIVGSVDVALVRSPGPVARSGGHSFVGGAAERIALAVLVNASRKSQVHAHSRRRLDRGGSERNGNIPVVGSRRRVVGIFELDGDGSAEKVPNFPVGFAGLVESRFVIRLADVEVEK